MKEQTEKPLQPTLIYGCMGLGGEWNQHPITAEDEKVATEAVETALMEGIRHFDHADIYTLGKAEEVFGRVLRNNPSLRDRMVIQSKAGIQIGAGPGGSNRYCARKTYLLEQAKAILKRLRIDCLDVFLVHRPDPLMDPREVSEAFFELKSGGFVKRFGVSNMSLPQLQLIQKYWDEPLVCNQLQISLGHSLFVDASVMINMKQHPGGGDMLGMKEYAQETGLALQAWGSSDQGKYLDGAHDGLHETDRKAAQLVWDMAQRYSISRTALVLAWLMKIPANIQPVIGTTKPPRIRECAQALTFEFSDEDWYQLWITARGSSLP
jgi:predicted oxidoreductase